MKLGKVFSIDGLDGSGKGTQTALLKEYLISLGYETLVVPSAGGTLFNEKIRKIFKEDRIDAINPLADSFLMLSNFINTTEQVIRPALAKGIIVILDRWFYSTLAYQGIDGYINVIRPISDSLINKGFIKKPDVSIHLDCDLDFMYANIAKRNQPMDRIEALGKDYFVQVKDIFNTLYFSNIVNGMDSIEAVSKSIQSIVNNTLNK